MEAEIDGLALSLTNFERDQLLAFIRRASLDGVFFDAGPVWEEESQRLLAEFNEPAEPA